MNIYEGKKIRNIALLSHSKAGTTSLAEAMAYNAGVISRIGKVEDGNTVCDYDSEEVKRNFSIRSSLVALEWSGHKLNIIDTPGYFDFVGEMDSAIAACDLGLIVLSGKSGVGVGTEIAFKKAEKQNLPVMFYVNKVDHENSHFDKVVEQMQGIFGTKAVPIEIPIFEDAEYKGYVDVIENKAYIFEGDKKRVTDIPEAYYGQAQDIKGTVCELIAEADEELLEKFFSDQPFTYEDLKNGIYKAVIARSIFPIMCGSAVKNKGVAGLMDNLVAFAPSPEDMPPKSAMLGEEIAEITFGDDQPLAAQVFKTIIDPFVGKLSLVRVYSGSVGKNANLYNVNKAMTEKIGAVMTLCGKEKIELEKVCAGDIFAVAKLTETETGDTFTTQGKAYKFDEIEFAPAVYTMAIAPKARGDEEKISAGMQKLIEEDKTLKFENNSEVKQLMVSGLGDQHIDIVVSRLKAMGTEVELSQPKVLYRETITKKIQAEGKHKKQSGGHGQYGHVKIEFEPCDSETLVFEENIFGGSVPKNFHPAVEKGLQEMMNEGIQAGYKVVGVKATLYDGSYHDVDSSEMAFKMAAHLAFKELVKAGPILLEPIGHLEVEIPDEFTGDIMGNINKKRGRVLGIEPGRVIAEIPMSEMYRYAIDLRSMTQGRGSFTFEFERYEQAPPMVVQKLIEEKKD